MLNKPANHVYYVIAFGVISKIGGFELIVLGTRLRDIRAPNQYKIMGELIRVHGFDSISLFVSSPSLECGCQLRGRESCHS